MEHDYIELPTELMQLITPDQAWHYMVMPRSQHNGNLNFYCSSDCDLIRTTEELEMIFCKKILLYTIPDTILKKNLSMYYMRGKNSDSADERMHASGNVPNSASRDFLDSVIDEANKLKCSDIHIEKYADNARVRFRIDGKLFERFVISSDDYPALVNKIKIQANLDIAEKRLPQDGRILFNGLSKDYDIRVSVIPALFGEKVVLRLLNQSATKTSINDLGFSEQQLSEYMDCIRQPNGIILISGPTGSGKTTTLYATLNILNNKDLNILTIEDPVEYTIEGINQVQMKENIGLTFGKALKTFLRQDPDIIMVGEVRDNETAQMAIRAALTGHLVFSTIHTNSAWGIVSRLIDMGQPPFLLASTLNAVVAQRLLRKLCPHCKKEEKEMNKNIADKFRDVFRKGGHYEASGCDYCHHSGYHGRIAVFEVIGIDTELRQMIRGSETDASSVLKRKGIETLSDSAINLYHGGVTSFNEIYPVLINNF